MRKIEREQKLRREMRRIYRALRTHGLTIEMRWLFEDRRQSGSYSNDGTNGQIRIDPYKEMIGTLVHEIYHHIEPKMPHRRVYANEFFIIQHATPRQLKNLLGYIVLHWRMALTDQRAGRHMPRCPFCSRRLQRVPGGESKTRE